MNNFRIIAPESSSFLRFKQVNVDTSVNSEGATTAKVLTSTGVTNPVYVASTGTIGSPSFFNRTKEQIFSGTESTPLNDAITALNQLGNKHGVVGIKLSSNQDLTGSVAFSDSPSIYTSGGPTTSRVGADNLKALDAAARMVLEMTTKTSR